MNHEEALKHSGHKIQPLPFERAAGRKNFDREEEKLYGSTPHITTGFPPTSGKPSSTSCGNTSLHQTGCIKSATRMSSNSATAVPPIWQTSFQLTTRSSLSATMANQNLNPVIADISRHVHCMATAETKQLFIKQLCKPKINPRTISDCAKLNLKQDSTTTTIPSIRIPKEMQPNFQNSFGPAKILV